MEKARQAASAPPRPSPAPLSRKKAPREPLTADRQQLPHAPGGRGPARPRPPTGPQKRPHGLKKPSHCPASAGRPARAACGQASGGRAAPGRDAPPCTRSLQGCRGSRPSEGQTLRGQDDPSNHQPQPPTLRPTASAQLTPGPPCGQAQGPRLTATGPCKQLSRSAWPCPPATCAGCVCPTAGQASRHSRDLGHGLASSPSRTRWPGMSQGMGRWAQQALQAVESHHASARAVPPTTAAPLC